MSPVSWPRCGGGPPGLPRHPRTRRVGSGGGVGDHGCRVYATGNQSLNNGSETVITFDAEEWDTDSYHSIVTNTHLVTIPSGQAGKYSLDAGVQVTSSTGSYRDLRLYKNSTLSALVRLPPASGTATFLRIHDVQALAEGDTVEVRVLVATASLNSVAGANYAPMFTVQRIA